MPAAIASCWREQQLRVDLDVTKIRDSAGEPGRIDQPWPAPGPATNRAASPWVYLRVSAMKAAVRLHILSRMAPQRVHGINNPAGLNSRLPPTRSEQFLAIYASDLDLGAPGPPGFQPVMRAAGCPQLRQIGAAAPRASTPTPRRAAPGKDWLPPIGSRRPSLVLRAAGLLGHQNASLISDGDIDETHGRLITPCFDLVIALGRPGFRLQCAAAYEQSGEQQPAVR